MLASTVMSLIEWMITLDPCRTVRYSIVILASVVSKAIKDKKAIGLITHRLFCCLLFGVEVIVMRYECTSQALYSKYRIGETLEYRKSNLKLLTDRANCGNSEAKKYMALIEPNNKQWRL